tara:strand:+ start:1670 stop:1972 length:303 start_codon:yes stop_codon:yes gene_type:complete
MSRESSKKEYLHDLSKILATNLSKDVLMIVSEANHTSQSGLQLKISNLESGNLSDKYILNGHTFEFTESSKAPKPLPLRRLPSNKAESIEESLRREDDKI